MSPGLGWFGSSILMIGMVYFVILWARFKPEERREISFLLEGFERRIWSTHLSLHDLPLLDTYLYALEII